MEETRSVFQRCADVVHACWHHRRPCSGPLPTGTGARCNADSIDRTSHLRYPHRGAGGTFGRLWRLLRVRANMSDLAIFVGSSCHAVRQAANLRLVVHHFLCWACRLCSCTYLQRSTRMSTDRGCGWRDNRGAGRCVHQCKSSMPISKQLVSTY